MNGDLMVIYGDLINGDLMGDIWLYKLYPLVDQIRFVSFVNNLTWNRYDIAARF